MLSTRNRQINGNTYTNIYTYTHTYPNIHALSTEQLLLKTFIVALKDTLHI